MQENNREISVIKKRILQYLEFKGVSKYKVYQLTGITNGVLSQKGGISEENLLKFLNYYRDINTEWLLYGRGEIIKKAKNINHESFNIKSDILIDKTLEMIKELSAENALLKKKLSDIQQQKTGYGFAAEPGE